MHDGSSFFCLDAKKATALTSDNNVLLGLADDDLQKISRLAAADNFVFVYARSRIMIVLPWDKNHQLLVLPNDFFQRELSSLSSLPSGSTFEKIQQLASLISMSAGQKIPLCQQVVFYVLADSQLGLVNQPSAKSTDDREKLFFFYQEQLADALQALDQRSVIRGMNQMKSLFTNRVHQNQLTALPNQRRLKELLISLACSLADHALDAGLSLEAAAQIRIMLIDQIYKHTIVDFHSEIKALVWPYFDALKLQNGEKNSDTATICRDYIDNHLDKKLSLKEIAEVASISKEALNPIFKNSFGLTVKQYVNQQKVALAKKFLAANKKSLQEITNALSLADKSYFVKLFHAETGMTPKQYRRSLFFKE
ncbi:MAG: AraC family transcriptional regulator [Oenococcus sp.]|uniref:helix-turn-helix domain-containing protein n=1 Tax=Oenococcus sp. TaxID=1979414 RepID=UPI0039EB62AE